MHRSDLSVTVVVPVYNRAQLVDRALESVLAQTRPADGVVVVDDGSTDDTLERLGRFGGAIEIVSQANAGASAARNVGVARARTRWVAFCDSDDHWVPDHLERVLGAVERTGGDAALYFDDTEIAPADGGGTFFEVAGLHLDGPLEIAGPVVPWVMARLQPMLLQTSVVRRSVYEGFGGLATELRVRHDTHLFFRIGFEHPMCAVQGIGAHLSADASADDRLTGATGRGSRSFWEESLWMWDDLVRRAPDATTRTALARRLAATHVKLAALAVRDRRLLVAGRQAARAVASSPAEVVRLTGRGIRRRLAGRARDDARIPRPA